VREKSLTTDHPVVIATVIPTRNRSGLLKRAIQSVLDQTYPHIRIYIYDNASEDDTEQVVRGFQEKDSRLVYHRHDRDIGAVNNFIFGLKRIDTPFFSILSDDDYLLPDFFKNAADEFFRHPDCGFVALGCCVSDGTKIIRKPSINDNMAGYYTPPNSFDVLLKEWMTLTLTSIVFRKAAVDVTGMFSDIPCLCNDIEYLLRVASRFPIVISREVGAVFTDNPSGMSSTTPLNLIWPCYLEMIEQVLNYPSLSAEQKKAVQRVLLGRLKKRLIYSSLSYVSKQDNKMAEEARIPLRDFFHAGGASRLLKIIIVLNSIAPWIVRPLVGLFIRKKHAIIYLLENIQHYLKTASLHH
jgi:glycosyltransferase involved in cell wall biosynthesis